MTNYLNKTSTVAWLVIALIVIVLVTHVADKKATGTSNFFGKLLKKKK
ncbi:MAG: hypothetical protein LBF90_03230 [Prevotellaceae bacterium]|jgi:hypothetical protein|nr:hypothetical protein [Prevotellaceae bacterium]